VIIAGIQPIGGIIVTPIFLAPNAYKFCHMHAKKFKLKSNKITHTNKYIYMFDEDDILMEENI
jgi:hypothetical protein